MLQNIFNEMAMYKVIRQMLDIIKKDTKTVIIDFSDLQNIEVGGVTSLSNVIEYLKYRKIDVQCINADSCSASAFLLGSGFLRKHTNNEKHFDKTNAEFLPLEFVVYNQSFSYITTSLIPWMATTLEQDKRALSSIQICLEEIFNNIKDHSTVNIGCSCAHHDKDQDRILICVADFGIGISQRVRGAIEIGSDQAAIAMACQDGFTTQTTPRNRGAGLHILIRNIVARNSGHVSIYSGNGIYECKPNQKKGTGRAAPSRYPGTLLYLIIDTKLFVPSEISEEEFSW